MYPCRLYGNLVTCTQSAYSLSAKAAGYSGTWETSFPKESLFSCNPFFFLSGPGWRVGADILHILACIHTYR